MTKSRIILIITLALLLFVFPFQNHRIQFLKSSNNVGITEYSERNYDPTDVKRQDIQGYTIANQPSMSINGVTAYTEHGPIRILNNSAFGPSGYNFPGYGNATHPYLIDTYNITGSTSDLIYIKDTNVNFVINNCIIDSPSGDYEGIILWNVKNGNITNCQILKIVIYYSTKIIVKNNNLSGTNYLWFSNETLIDANTISVLICRDCKNIDISNNNYDGLGLPYLGGILIERGENIQINGNQFRNYPHGVLFYGYSINILFNNNSFVNNSRGIMLPSVGITNCTIVYNSFIFNQIYSLHINTKTTGTAMWNNFYESSAYYDYNRYSHGFIFQKNYWSSWTGPDDNEDGYIDQPYIFDGEGEYLVSDSYPLSVPFEEIIWKPLLEFPNGGEILSGKITIQWTTIGGILFPNLIYSLFLSIDEGNLWSVLANNISETSYLLNTLIYPDLKNCLIKVKATNLEGGSLETISANFFTITNNPESFSFLKGLESVQNGTYEIEMKLEGKTFRGTTTKKILEYTQITTSFGDFSDVIMISFSDCNLTSNSQDYIEIKNWNDYYSEEKNKMVKSEIRWIVHIGGYLRQNLAMTSEYGSYQVLYDNAGGYAEQYMQNYYENGKLKSITNCTDVYEFVKMDTIPYECLVYRLTSYENDIYLAYSLTWIRLNDGLELKVITYDENNIQILSMEKLESIVQDSSSSSRTSIFDFILIFLITPILIKTRKRRKSLL